MPRRRPAVKLVGGAAHHHADQFIHAEPRNRPRAHRFQRFERSRQLQKALRSTVRQGRSGFRDFPGLPVMKENRTGNRLTLPN